MKNVFLSYAREDTEMATRIYEFLTSIDGVEPWFDKECLLPGMRWRPAIRKAIREADFFLALISEKSNSRKGFVHREMREALEIMKEFPEDQIYIIPARLDECIIPFDELREIHYVDLFPDWQKGFESIVQVFESKSQSKPDIRVHDEKTLNLPYHYKVGLVDLDLDSNKLGSLVSHLNIIQNFINFELCESPIWDQALKSFFGTKNLSVYEIPKLFYSHQNFMNVDLVVCLTKYPLAFKRGSYLEYNYLSGPSEKDERFMFISTKQLDEFARAANCSFEKVITYNIVSQLVVYFTDIGFHPEIRGCVMDFCEYRPNMVLGLKRMEFCSYCLSEINNQDFSTAIKSILSDRIEVQ